MGAWNRFALVCCLALSACTPSAITRPPEDAAPLDVGADDVASVDDAQPADDVASVDDAQPADDVAPVDDAVTVTDAPTTCGAGQHRCDGVCVRNDDPEACGARCAICPRAVSGTPRCVAGACQLECDAAHHLCGAACPSDDDPRTCGSRCTPCPAPTNGVATCASGACSFTCDAGYTRSGSTCVPSTCPAGQRLCGSTCRACPTANVETTRCDAANLCVPETCAPGYRVSGSSCVEVPCASGERRCGGACAACPTEGVTTSSCSGASCVATSCATGYALSMGRCSAITCAAGERLCGSACRACPSANVVSTACSGAGLCVATACATGYTVQSDGSCAAIACGTNRRFCGASCVACPSTGVAATTCSGSTCVAMTCAAGYRLDTSGACVALSCTAAQRACGSTCAACPTDGVTATACGAGDTCVATACAADYTLTDGRCVPLPCPSGQRSCGGTCRPCPTSNVATTTCSGPACLAATCADGYGVVGGACVAMACSAGSLYCATACSACPTTGAATTGCAGATCVARTCASGYSLLADSPDGIPRCVAAGWTMELVAMNVPGSTSTATVALALDASGRPVVAYYEYPNVVVAVRGASGFTRTTVATSSTSLVTVKRLVVDARGNAHVIYRDYKSVGSFDSTYGWYYLRLAPDGAVSMRVELGDERTFGEALGIGLAADGNGDAHVAYVSYGGSAYAAYYRRTYMGAWLAPVTAGSLYGACGVAVNAVGDDVHIGCAQSSSIWYLHGASSVFPAPLTLSVSGRTYDEVQVYAAAGRPVELWLRDDRSYFATTVGAAIAAPAAWGAFTDRASFVSGGRGPSDFASLEQASQGAPVLFRRGPTSGPAAPVSTNLPLAQVLPSLAVDASGNVFGLGRQSSSAYRMTFYLLRGR